MALQSDLDVRASDQVQKTTAVGRSVSTAGQPVQVIADGGEQYEIGIVPLSSAGWRLAGARR